MKIYNYYKLLLQNNIISKKTHTFAMIWFIIVFIFCCHLIFNPNNNHHNKLYLFQGILFYSGFFGIISGIKELLFLDNQKFISFYKTLNLKSISPIIILFSLFTFGFIHVVLFSIPSILFLFLNMIINIKNIIITLITIMILTIFIFYAIFYWLIVFSSIIICSNFNPIMRLFFVIIILLLMLHVSAATISDFLGSYWRNVYNYFLILSIDQIINITYNFPEISNNPISYLTTCSHTIFLCAFITVITLIFNYYFLSRRFLTYAKQIERKIKNDC